MSSSTLAAGVRMPYERLPAAVRRWVERELGSVVTVARTQSGGFSPGAAARLETASGRRAFLKAVGTPLNPDSPRLFRAEQQAMAGLARLGPRSWLPRLYGGYDDGVWVGLLLEDVAGRQPGHPWTAEDADLVFAALADLAPTLDPSPWPDAPACDLSGLVTRCHELAVEPPPDLPAWLAGRLEELAALAERAARTTSGSALLHLDVRADNLLLADDGRVVLVDWAAACRGAAWLDPVLLAADLIGSGSPVDVAEVLGRHPLTSRVSEGDVVAVLAAVGGMLTNRGRAPEPAGLPTIRAWQRTVGEALVRWAGRRLGWL